MALFAASMTRFSKSVNPAGTVKLGVVAGGRVGMVTCVGSLWREEFEVVGLAAQKVAAYYGY